MNRKITDFAFGAKWGGRGASGLAPTWVWALAKKPSCDRRPVSAKPVKPAPTSQRNSRRVRPQKLFMDNYPRLFAEPGTFLGRRLRLSGPRPSQRYHFHLAPGGSQPAKPQAAAEGICQSIQIH